MRSPRDSSARMRSRLDSAAAFRVSTMLSNVACERGGIRFSNRYKDIFMSFSLERNRRCRYWTRKWRSGLLLAEDQRNERFELREGEEVLPFDPGSAAFEAGLVFIGRIRSPWTTREACPKNMAVAEALGGGGRVEIDAAYRPGLEGLGAFSHADRAQLARPRAAYADPPEAAPCRRAERRVLAALAAQAQPDRHACGEDRRARPCRRRAAARGDRRARRDAGGRPEALPCLDRRGARGQGRR